MNATWRSTGSMCHERGWSRHRLIHELQNGLPNRIVPHPSVPPGHVIDWSDDAVLSSLDVAASEVTITLGGKVAGPGAERIDEYGNVIDPPLRSPSASRSCRRRMPRQRQRRHRGRERKRGERRRRLGQGLSGSPRNARPLPPQDVDLKLGDYTEPELRQLVLEQIKSDEPERTGIALPSRQTVNRVIRRRLLK